MPQPQPGAGALCASCFGHEASIQSPPVGQGAAWYGPASRSSPGSPATVQVRRPYTGLAMTGEALTPASPAPAPAPGGAASRQASVQPAAQAWAAPVTRSAP